MDQILFDTDVIIDCLRGDKQAIHHLSEQEKHQGFELLFGGETTANWRGILHTELPESGLEIKDGVLTIVPFQIQLAEISLDYGLRFCQKLEILFKTGHSKKG